MSTSTQPAPPQPMSMAAVLRESIVMRRLWYAQIVSIFGDFLALFAVISVLTFKLRVNAEQITGVQIAYLLPIAILGVIAGVFVDRWPLKPTMVASDLLRAGLVLLLLLASKTWHYYAILAAISVVSSFFGPAQGVAIRSAVPLHGLRSANALIQQVFLGMRIIGPAVAAFLVGSFGPQSCYLADSASFIGSALLITSVALIKPAAAPAASQTTQTGASPLARVWSDMRQGIDFIVHHAALLFVLLAMASGMFILGCFGPLIAVYVRDQLHASSQIFGAASALIGVGMLIGINALTMFATKWKNSTLVYCGLGGIAAGLVILAALTQVWSTFLGNFVIGFTVAGIIIPAQTLIQQETPPALMGRVGSTVMSLIFTAQVAGLILSGILAQHAGVRQVFALCALALCALIAVGRIWMEPRKVGQALSPAS
jgi:DHA3 family macrolide efflux protein-like MFS transporter